MVPKATSAEAAKSPMEPISPRIEEFDSSTVAPHARSTGANSVEGDLTTCSQFERHLRDKDLSRVSGDVFWKPNDSLRQAIAPLL